MEQQANTNWKARGGGHSCASPGSKEDRSEMLDWCSGVDGDAPYTENEHGNFERCDTQAVAKAYGRTIEEAQARARLIAMAPEMLDLLQRVEKDMAAGVVTGSLGSLIVGVELRAAIARATGEAA